MDLAATVDPNVSDYIYKDYYTTGGLAYTEDHFLVYKIFVYKIPRETTVGEVQEHFSQYGNIRSVCFVADNNQDYPNVAFVHFECPTAAAKVLNFYHTTFAEGTDVLYLVEACHSKYQPNCQPTKEILRNWFLRPKYGGEEDQFVPPNRDSILVLNDDCLENVIRFLPISSQLHFARTCSRICQVFEMTCKSLYRTLFLEHLVGLTQWQIRDFFDFAGDNIVRIEGRLSKENHQRIVKFISIFCSNIKELELDSSMLIRSGNDSFAQLIHKLKKLKTLKLSESFQLSGKDLNNLSPTIESLSVDCIDVEDEHIISLCKSLSNLKELNLGETFCFKDDVSNAMAVSCQNLETLTFGHNQSDYRLIAKLPKLKNLTVLVSMRYNYCPSLLTQLIKHKSHQLQFLFINGNNCVTVNVAQQISQLKSLRTLHCPHNFGLTDKGLKHFWHLEHLEEIDLTACVSITNTALLNLVLKCEKLKRVDIHSCHLISNELIFELIQKFQEQIQNKTFMRTEPILLIARSTKINEDILNNPEYKASSHLVIVDIVDN